MSRLCIIPARGGSKRIPRKNIRPFLGRPIIAYSIETALESGLFDEVMVSTDDDEVASVAASFGAKIPFMRSPVNSLDHSITLDVIREVVDFYAKKGESYDEVCCLYPTAPFANSSLLRQAYDLFKKENFDCVFPAVRFGFPIQRAIKIDGKKRMNLFQPEHQNARSQDLTPAYHDGGMFYWFRPEVVLPLSALWTENTGCIELNELQAQDIDTEIDWQLAEIKYKLLNG